LANRALIACAPPLTDDDVQQIVQTSARRIIRLCMKRGLLDDAQADPLTDEEPVLAAIAAASVRGLIATGERTGQRLRRVLRDPATGVRTAPLCFAVRGFSLHAATRITAADRLGLERLCRYVARGDLRVRPPTVRSSPALGSAPGAPVRHRRDDVPRLRWAHADHRRPHRREVDTPLSTRYGPARAGSADRSRPTPSTARIRRRLIL
jgi:hypothetical protein